MSVPRRDALRLMAGGSAAALLPGCSARADDDPAGTTAPPSSAAQTEASRRTVAAVTDVPADGALDVTGSVGEAAYLVRAGDEVRLLSGTCSHAECLVAWVAEQQQFHCPCHLGVYDRFGQVVSGPPPRPLAEIPMTVEAGTVYTER